MHIADLFVLGLYAFGMLCIGRYYERRTETKEEYLNGGRNMNPIMIGLSLFATLTSTISYLAFPGEMIKNGPMMFAQLLCFPFAFILVGWWLIPAIMKQNHVSSGYELLELKLGLSGRLIGAGMFVVIRMVWMAAILYSLSDKVIVPLFKLDPQWSPWISLITGIFTVVYTSAGGMRAVVLTDVIQAIIMFFGAVFVIFTITVSLGGVSEWWPGKWALHWQEPIFWFRSDVRITFMGAFLNMFVWMLCTSGSDQMAIQRYLSMSNPKVARKAFGIQMIVEIIMGALLGLVGLAVLGFYSAHQNQFGVGVDLITKADELFPSYIANAMPVGFSGLVIAALFSAAMSSLSSGMNSSSAVIESDFINRFSPNSDSKTNNLNQVRVISAVVGIFAILISTVIGKLGENLLEIGIKAINLLTAPLFVLFFLALFIRRATPLSGIISTIVSVTVAISISFFNIFGLEFMWSAPCSLLAGISAGILTSLLPIEKKNLHKNINNNA